MLPLLTSRPPLGNAAAVDHHHRERSRSSCVGLMAARFRSPRVARGASAWKQRMVRWAGVPRSHREQRSRNDRERWRRFNGSAVPAPCRQRGSGFCAWHGLEAPGPLLFDMTGAGPKAAPANEKPGRPAGRIASCAQPFEPATLRDTRPIRKSGAFTQGQPIVCLLHISQVQ